jgi:hypothetical protein
MEILGLLFIGLVVWFAYQSCKISDDKSKQKGGKYSG